ncbi:MAG: homocysteine biosynthesis protein [Candidatus Atribacteria bacterium]|nr:homocysteine biosynthesis protein [Candidatus Atribacteria bacterium]
MTIQRTYEEINTKIRSGKAVIVTAEEIIPIVKEKGIEKATEEIDVVTTGTFGPMCSSGTIINFGHSDPPIRMQKVWLNDVEAYAGLAAVDVYLGATQLSESQGMEYGGAHVIEDLISGKKIKLKAISQGTDCYPRREIESYITKESINQAVLFNPRNGYQNYNVAVNTSDRKIYTYMGILLPNIGNANYCTSSQLSPLLNDPEFITIGIGTRIFLGGAQGYIAWEGTQFYPQMLKGEEGKAIYKGGTLAVVGDLKKMSTDYIRAATFKGYGVTLVVGIGIPIPILNSKIMKNAAVKDEDIWTEIIDYSFPHLIKPSLGRVNYKQLREGNITIRGKNVPTSPLSSYAKAREIAQRLKEEILRGKFLLQEPIQKFPKENKFKSLLEIH